MLIYINLIFSVTKLLQMFPIAIEQSAQLKAGAVFLWLEIEWITFSAIILSDVLFLMFRTCLHHKI